MVDRCWQFIKKHIGQRSDAPGSVGLRARIRSAQWAYWMRGQDLWKATGEMIHDEMSRMF